MFGIWFGASRSERRRGEILVADAIETKLIRTFAATIDDVSKPKRSVTAKVNTGVVDRYRTVIPPSGGKLDNFMRSPAVLWEHGHDPTRGRMPVAKCSSVKYRPSEDDLLAKMYFSSDDYSRAVFDFYSDKTLTSFSIEFLPDPSSSSRPRAEELRARPEWKDADVIYRKWELTGISAVAAPGNPEAVTIMVERGLWVPEEVRAAATAPITTTGQQDEEEDEDEDDELVKRYITHEGSKWIVHAEDGKVLGTHDNREDAVKQLQAIEAHKHQKSYHQYDSYWNQSPAHNGELDRKLEALIDETRQYLKHEESKVESEPKVELGRPFTIDEARPFYDRFARSIDNVFGSFIDEQWADEDSVNAIMVPIVATTVEAIGLENFKRLHKEHGAWLKLRQIGLDQRRAEAEQAEQVRIRNAPRRTQAELLAEVRKRAEHLARGGI
jgi:hypothetical protein